jgi:hypothetical protein
MTKTEHIGHAAQMVTICEKCAVRLTRDFAGWSHGPTPELSAPQRKQLVSHKPQPVPAFVP